MEKPEIQPYESLREVGSNIYCLDGEWYQTPFRRRMTIIRMKYSGGLLIHSPIALKEENYNWIDAIGNVDTIIAPNRFHCSDVHAYVTRYPEAKLLISQGAVKEIQKQSHFDGILPEGWKEAARPETRSEILCLEFQGTRMLHESVFFHIESKFLVTTDLVFNLQREFSGAQKLFFKLNKIDKRFGPSRIFQHVFLQNKEKARKSLEQILSWDFEGVIMSHGEILFHGGKDILRNGFAEIGLKI